MTRPDAMERWAAARLVDPVEYWGSLWRGVEREDPADQAAAVAAAFDAFARRFPGLMPPGW